MEGPQEELSDVATDAARKHGKLRYQQGYTIPQILFEARVLQHVLTSTIHENLFGLDLSTLVGDILEIGETLQADAEISIRVYQSQIPALVANILLVVIPVAIPGRRDRRREPHHRRQRRLSAHDRTASRAAGGGEHRLACDDPERFRPLDLSAMEQLREFGTCVPYEKEFFLPDGSSVPFLIGAVRLSAEPLQWSAYVVELTEQRKLQAAEEKMRAWETKYLLINQLAHELNNPLAAMTFTLHLLSTHPHLSNDTQALVNDASVMLKRHLDYRKTSPRGSPKNRPSSSGKQPRDV